MVNGLNELQIESAAGWSILARGRLLAHTINYCANRQEQSSKTSSRRL